MTEGVTATARSWRLRAGLRPGPVHAIWRRGLSERSACPACPACPEQREGTSSCGAETPQSSSPRRAGTTPRKTKAKILDPRSESGMTEGWIPDRGLSLTFLIEDRA